MDEIRGLAEGAGVTFADAMAVNIRGELGQVKEGGCTAYAVKRQGEILIGQNSDMTTEIPPLAYVLHLKPADKPEVLIWTFGGMLGYHGINSAGIGQFANALGGGPRGQFGMPHYPVKRMMLECRTSAEVVDLLRKIPLASNGNYVMCDSKRDPRRRGDHCGPGDPEGPGQRLRGPHQPFRVLALRKEREFRPELAGLLPAAGSHQLAAGRSAGLR